jgi:atypical dual specificity phosphatase
LWSTSLIDFLSTIYRKSYALVMGRPSNFSWLVTGEVAGSGFPGSHRAIKWLRGKGVGVIVSLTDEDIGSAFAQRQGIKVYSLPMVNMEGAGPEALDHAVDLMCSRGGEKVLVHCLAGMGRTGMVLCAYLVRERGLSADEAIAEVKRLRPGSLKRRVQQRAIRDYEAYLVKVGRSKAPS